MEYLTFEIIILAVAAVTVLLTISRLVAWRRDAKRRRELAKSLEAAPYKLEPPLR